MNRHVVTTGNEERVKEGNQKRQYRIRPPTKGEIDKRAKKERLKKKKKKIRGKNTTGRILPAQKECSRGGSNPGP